MAYEIKYYQNKNNSDCVAALVEKDSKEWILVRVGNSRETAKSLIIEELENILEEITNEVA